MRRLPSLAGAVAFAIGIVNLVSALTPTVAWRGHLLLQVMPVRTVPIFHSVAVPASVALIVSSLYLRRRRKRAWAVAFGLLVALGVLDLAKGLDLEEALLSWGGAAVLWQGRGAFYVEQARLGALRLLGAAIALSAASVSLLVWVASGRGDDGFVLHQTIHLFSFTHGSMAFRDELGWVPGAVGALTLALIVIAEWLLFLPRRPPRTLPDEHARRKARELVHAYGNDTLAYFKLRQDLQYLFTGDRRAFLGYRIENGVMLVAGDPVGAVDAVQELVHDARRFAEIHGLRITAIGAGKRLVPLWRAAGLHAVYIGDEAIVETAAFSLEGRAIRKVRQSMSRLEKAGYDANVHALAELDAEGIAELEDVSSLWRSGRAERGFAMAMDALGDGIVVVGRDRKGTARGFLHFVPAQGRAAVSLSFMRRDPTTPNGLMEFLVVRAIELLRERGIAELSLNFVMFGRLMQQPTLRRLIRFGSRWFQMESLYRFTAKFSPRWEARYFVFDRLLGLPRAGIAALWAEGQLPRLRAQASASSAMPSTTSPAPARRAWPARSRKETSKS